MSRSIRDLRDIVNISRLSVRNEQLSDYSSEEEEEEEEVNSEVNSDEEDELYDYIATRTCSFHLKSVFKTPVTTSMRPSTAMGERTVSRTQQQQQQQLQQQQQQRGMRPSSAPAQRKSKDEYEEYEVDDRDDVCNKSGGRTPHKTTSFQNKYTPIPPIGKSNDKCRTTFTRHHQIRRPEHNNNGTATGSVVSPIDNNSVRVSDFFNADTV